MSIFSSAKVVKQEFPYRISVRIKSCAVCKAPGTACATRTNTAVDMAVTVATVTMLSPFT